MTFLILGGVIGWVLIVACIISVLRVGARGDRVHPPVRRHRW